MFKKQQKKSLMNIIADTGRNSREKPGKNQGNPKLGIRRKSPE